MAKERKPRDRPLVDPCPECKTEHHSILPSYGNCQNCLRLRMEFLEERAAVYEFDGGLSREEAERRAREEVL